MTNKELKEKLAEIPDDYTIVFVGPKPEDTFDFRNTIDCIKDRVLLIRLVRI